MKFIFVLFFFLMQASSQETFKLEYKFEKGKTYRYKDFVTSKVTQEMMGTETRIDTKSEFIHKIVVDSVGDNGDAVLIVSFDSVRVSIQQKKLDTTIIVNEIIGKRKKNVLSKFGEVLQKAVIDKIKMGNQMGGDVSQEVISFPIFTDKELKIGDKWKSTSLDTMDLMGSKIAVKTNASYKIVKKETKLDHECLKIEYEAETESEGKSDMFGVEMYLESSGDIEGVIYFDPKTGLVIYEEAETDQTITLATTGARSMMIPITQTSKLKRTIVE
ncbi:MAG: DUF6263 family protein [Bacteroidota bacterium]|nr:DUF6263 family protein [Bacteroidota bacterium]